MSKRLDDFMINVFPWKTITIMLSIIATCEMVQVIVMFWRHG
jgi:hypothetical protein